jgi:hypothetical protein
MESRAMCIAAGMFSLALLTPAGQPKNLPLQKIGPGRPAQAGRAASCTLIDGRIVLTGDWVSLPGPTTRTGCWNWAWDSYETLGNNPDPSSAVIWDDTPGCTASIQPGARYFFGPTYHNPFVSGDLDNAVPGVACEGLFLTWYIDVGNSEPDNDFDGLPDSPLFIAVLEFEDMDVVSCTDDGTNFIGGVIYDFSGNAWDPNFFNLAQLNLKGSSISHPMPADGTGGYQVIFATAFDPSTGILTIPAAIDPMTQLGVNVQPMLWGTDDGEPLGGLMRVGTQVDGQFDDDAPTDGAHDLALECYSYLYGACPDPLGVCIGFSYAVPPVGVGLLAPFDQRVRSCFDTSDYGPPFGTFSSQDPTGAACAVVSPDETALPGALGVDWVPMPDLFNVNDGAGSSTRTRISAQLGVPQTSAQGVKIKVQTLPFGLLRGISQTPTAGRLANVRRSFSADYPVDCVGLAPVGYSRNYNIHYRRSTAASYVTASVTLDFWHVETATFLGSATGGVTISTGPLPGVASFPVFGPIAGFSGSGTLRVKGDLVLEADPAEFEIFDEDFAQCPDFDGDGVVGLGDLTLFLSNFGAGFGGDINFDGATDISDLALLLGAFGSTCD